MLHTLKIREGSRTYDLVNDFGFVCLEGGSYPTADKFKELYSTSWYDEHGIDVYFPNQRKLESFDIEIPIGCEGSRASGGTTVAKLYNDLQTFFLNSGMGEGLSIYLPLEQKGYNRCYIKEINEKDYSKYGDYEIFTCKLVICVTNPADTWNYE